MVTGDHPDTARAIACAVDVGLVEPQYFPNGCVMVHSLLDRAVGFLICLLAFEVRLHLQMSQQVKLCKIQM